ncbi:MAG: tRNA uridine-5-carboxymethylaminomethyl(34) synthesis GTPase MnmE [Nitrospinota bacterium]|nr:tRNA uridine-5-carboxymethylaminomethyl(34) synthesis GTPase MnmE [Nitrospinota bacterium]
MEHSIMTDSIAAIATPIGEGGINIIRISGSDAVGIASSLFQPQAGGKVSDLEPQRVVFGNITDPATSQAVDEVLLIRFRAPHSYTGEDVVEIHGHGGAFVSSRILQLVLDQGARPAEPGEFTRRAFLNGRLDLSQAEAVADVIHAASDKALTSAVAQLKGQLSKKLNTLYDALLQVLGQLEAAIDFPEEGLEFVQKQKLEQSIQGTNGEIQKLIDSYRQGEIYREGLRVALVGKPNVGKSSLLNALLQEDRAIVTAHPGTTRDTLEERVRINDIHITIVDTAGLRHEAGEIEEHGIERTRHALAQADLALVIFDGSHALDTNDAMLIKEVAEQKKLILLNKSDLPTVINKNSLLKQLKTNTAIALSAVTGDGMEELKDALYQSAQGGRTSGESIIITRERHRQALVQTQEALGRVSQSLQEDRSEDLIAVDLNSALEHLGGILGKTFVDDLLDQIFNDFCIGK